MFKASAYFLYYNYAYIKIYKLCCHFDLYFCLVIVNPLRANFTKWSNTLKQFVSKLSTNCLSVLDHFVGLVLNGLIEYGKANFEI